MSPSEEPQRRRRGDALETALLDAAWSELQDRGYDAMTIDAVAARAGTSRAVIYRRWPGKPELVTAAIQYGLTADPVTIPDTGTLRGDLIELMTLANARRAGIAIVLSARLGEFYRETGTSISHLRQLIGAGSGVSTIMNRGVERGEIDPAKLTPRIANLPFDLFRLEVLMTFRPLPDGAIEEIVDTIFLPLVRP